MHVTERRSGDLAKLGALVRREPHAEQRYRLLAVVKAIDARERLAIAEPLSRSLAFVERWVYAHRDRGIEAIAARKRGGDRSKIKGVMAARLKARLDAGPTPADMVCVLRGKDVQRIAKQELGADVSLTTVHRTLQRLGDSCLAPRPRREKQDLDAQRQFREVTSPLLSAESRSGSPRRVAGPAASAHRDHGRSEVRAARHAGAGLSTQGNTSDGGQADPGFMRMGGKFT
jgi:transposase